MRVVVAIFLVMSIASISARSIVKRNNQYGDEPVTPALASAAPATLVVSASPALAASSEAHTELSAGGYKVPAAPAPVVPAEEKPAEVHQAAPAAVPQQASGYRHKRGAQNSYGDEALAPSFVAPAVVAPAPEQVPAAQPAPAPAPAAVRSSGY